MVSLNKNLSSKWSFGLILNTLFIFHASLHASGKNLIWIITDEHNLRTLGCYRDTMAAEQAEIWGAGNVVETPHIDRIADNGVLFTRMHSSTPICTPSRGSMFTGIYAHNLGISNNSSNPGDGKYLRSDVITIADVLRDANYLTSYIGKWHLSERKAFEKDPAGGGKWWQPYAEDNINDDYGFTARQFMFNGGHDKWYGIVTNGLPATANALPTPTQNGDPYPVNLKNSNITFDRYETEDGQLFDDSIHSEEVDGKLPFYSDGDTDQVRFTTDWLFDRSKEFLSDFKNGTYNIDNPGDNNDLTYESFFYVISIPDPHSGDSVRAPYNTMFTESVTGWTYELPRTWLNPNYDPNDPYTVRGDNPNWMVADGKAADANDPNDPGNYVIQTRIPQYFGMVKCIDENIGRLIRHLENENLLQDTLILFSADHGDLFGEHRRVNKGTPYDTSMRVPFVLVDGSQLVTPVTNTAPLVPRGLIVEEAANTTDWMETFLNLLGVDNIPDTPGRDLTPLFDPAGVEDWDNVSITRKGGWICAMDSRHKLVMTNPAAEATWLLDIEADPDEFINYLGEPAYEAVARKLAQNIKDYMAANNDLRSTVANKADALLTGWTRFASLNNLNPDQSGDQDGDGISDVLEYNAGSDPNDPSSLPPKGVVLDQGTGSFVHRERFPPDPALPLAAEWSLNLQDWSDDWSSVRALPDQSGFFQIQRTPNTTATNHVFFRLKSEIQNP